MSGDTPFFLSDPRPVDFMDPDDPRPVDFMDPDDPRPVDFMDPDDPRPVDFMDPDDPRPVDFMDPDDPRPVDFMDPDDPRPVDFMDPDDPRPVDFMDPDDPRPVDFMDPDDPAVRQAVRLLRRRRVRRRRGGGRGRPPVRRRPRRFPLEYSARVVVRLSAELDLPSLDSVHNLRTAAERLKLTGLRRVLTEYRVSGRSTGRMVDVEFRDVDLECESAQQARNGQERDEPDEQTGDDGGDDVGQSEVGGRKPAGSPPEAEETPVDPPEPRTRVSTWDLERQAASSVVPPLHSLAAYWRIDAVNQPRNVEPAEGEMRLNGWTPSPEHTVRAMLRELNELPEVDLAYRELAVSDPGQESEDTYAVVQEYLDRAPVGIGARWLWKQKVSVDGGIRFLDLEQGWTRQEDLGSIDPDLRLVHGHNRDGEGEYRGHHGTAVLGQVVGIPDNKLGIRGIAGDARVVLLASHYDKNKEATGDVAKAIRQAIAWMDAGDVLLLEVQRSYMPTEVDPLDRDAIRLAVSRGIIVIEAAGNGNANLDHYVDEEGRRVLSRRHPDYRESGAIMVAAARTAPPHNRLAGRVGVGSNHGTRIDCYAHGDRIVTTGYGDLNGYLEGGQQPDPLTAYTSSFGGTSGAAPIIAGAALVVQGVHKSQAESLLSPWEMRRLLSDPATGTRQGSGVGGRIGVMPDLKRTLRERLGLVSDPYLRDNPQDDGALPAKARTSCSPDIVVLKSGAAPKPFDDSYPGPGELRVGQPHSVFVRVRNRGVQPCEELALRLFCSPVATLVTPDLWQEIGKERIVPVSSGTATPPPEAITDQPVWTDAIPWTPGPPHPTLDRGDGKAVRHCFTAIVRDSRDDEVVQPPSQWPYFDWRRYQGFLAWHNNVTCRNVHMVDSGSEPGLPFLLTGTPDVARVFDLEILRCLPPETKVRLSTHPAVASALRRYRLWKAEKEVVDGLPRVKLTLPRQARLLVSGVRLIAGARFPCRLDIEGSAGEGHSLAIRQLYRGREVGRITWRFR